MNIVLIFIIILILFYIWYIVIKKKKREGEWIIPIPPKGWMVREMGQNPITGWWYCLIFTFNDNKFVSVTEALSIQAAMAECINKINNDNVENFGEDN